MVQIVLQTSDTFSEMLSILDIFLHVSTTNYRLIYEPATLCPKPFKFWIILFMFQSNVRPISYCSKNQWIFSEIVPTLNSFVHVSKRFYRFVQELWNFSDIFSTLDTFALASKNCWVTVVCSCFLQKTVHVKTF